MLPPELKSPVAIELYLMLHAAEQRLDEALARSHAYRTSLAAQTHQVVESSSLPNPQQLPQSLQQPFQSVKNNLNLFVCHFSPSG
jgi:hypothetical protein